MAVLRWRFVVVSWLERHLSDVRCGKGEFGLDFAVILTEDFDAGFAELEDVAGQLVVFVEQEASVS